LFVVVLTPGDLAVQFCLLLFSRLVIRSSLFGIRQSIYFGPLAERQSIIEGQHAPSFFCNFHIVMILDGCDRLFSLQSFRLCDEKCWAGAPHRS
jgi:hypothetical protein